MNLRLNHRLGVTNVKYFNKFELNLRYDSLASTFSFALYFDPTNREHAEMACVSHFHEAIVEHKGERLMTGFILSQVYNLSSKKELLQIGGYSKPGVLEDCEIPTNMYPLQDDGKTFRQICERIISPFHLKLVVDDVAKSDASKSIKTKIDKAIKKTTASESKNIKTYLTDLATQRDLVLSHDEMGNVLLTEAKTDGEPLFHIENSVIGTHVSMSFSGQGIHSHITVIKEANADGGNAGEYTIRNPYCPVAHVFRPRVINQTSGDDISIQETAQNALAAELKNITLTVTTDRWVVNGKILRPNNVITVKHPELFLYKKTTWFIESIHFSGDEKKTIAVLTCVLPEVYNKKTPVNIFVNPHENLPRF